MFVCFYTLVPHSAMASEVSIGMKKHPKLVDSILDNVLLYSSKYEKIIAGYDAELYLKRSMQIKKKNFLLRFAPSTLRTYRNVKHTITESLSEFHYSAPNVYDMRIKAMNGNTSRLSGPSELILPYFKVNIYSSTLLYDKLLSPLASNARDYYRYRIESAFISNGEVKYKIKVIPKIRSYQLVSGYMIVSNPTWKVRELYIQGQTEYMKYNAKISMGEKDSEEYLPVKYDIDVFVRMLGNDIDINYLADLKYSNIRLNEDGVDIKRKNRHYHDLTESFSLSCLKDSCITDSTSFSRLRPIPLSDNEKLLYRDFALSRDSFHINGNNKKKDYTFWGQIEDVLTNSYTVNMSSIGSVKCSPIINPFLLSYSHNDGIAYRQDFKYNRLFADGRLLRIVPKIGYNFKRREFYWTVNSNYDYWPEKRASIQLKFGNGNRIYSSKVVEKIKDIPDSLFNFDDLHLDYFNDLFFELNHSVEVTNGFFIKAGVTVHQRDAVKPSTIIILQPGGESDGSLDIISELKTRYISFAPRLQLEWTPGQFYYLKGNRKINLYSYFPTFSFDYERGIKGVLNSTGRYEKIEVDMQHHIRLGLMRDIYYRVGAGAFTNKHELYFVDFANFSKRNLPVGWNDDIGGVFQLLDRRWYNSSDHYARAHFTYQSPFLLLPHLKKLTCNVLNERLYFSALCVPHLNPYLEFGYGIGTHVFDAGIFVSYSKTSFKQIGCKFTFELFNR